MADLATLAQALLAPVSELALLASNPASIAVGSTAEVLEEAEASAVRVVSVADLAAGSAAAAAVVADARLLRAK